MFQLAMPVSPSPALWLKQLAIRLSCQKTQLSRWLPRREKVIWYRFAMFTLNAAEGTT